MTLPRSYFDELYRASDDPWSFRTRRYEARKRALTLDSLVDESYVTAFEPGCSIGTLTTGLAGRCDSLLAMDISAAALDLARATVPEGVTLVQGALPGDWPAGAFDLVVLSEVGYYLDAGDCAELARLATTHAAELLAVHWRHPVDDYPLSGDEVHEILSRFAELAGLTHAVHHLEADLVLDVWTRDPKSLAQRTFLAAP